MANELGTTASYETAIQIAKISAWDAAPGSNAYKPYAVPSESVTRSIEERMADVMDGKLSASDQHRRQGKKGAQGQIVHYLRTDCWLELLELCFGKLTSGDPAFDKASELQLFNVEIDKGADIYRAVNCRTASFGITSEQDSGHLTLTQNIIGADCNPGVSALTSTTAVLPSGQVVQHYELTLSVNGTVVEPVSLEINVDHALDGNIYCNSQIRRAIKRANKRAVTGVMVLHNNAATKTILQNWHNDTVFGFSAAWSNGGDTLTLETHTPASAGARLLGEVPSFNAGGGVTPIRLPFKCFDKDGDDELICEITTA